MLDLLAVPGRAVVDLEAGTLEIGAGAAIRLYNLEDVEGGAGDDRIQGDAGSNRLDGRKSQDRVSGDAGVDTVLGGLGDDDLDGGSGRDLVYGHGGRDLLRGGSGVDGLQGGRGADRLLDQADDGLRDVLASGQGSDLLRAGDGNDALFGGRGRDILNGGADDDQMTGGAGADVFVIEQQRGSADSDVITDLVIGTDIVRVEGYGLTAVAQLTLVQRGADVEVTIGDDTLVLLRRTDVDALASGEVFVFA